MLMFFIDESGDTSIPREKVNGSWVLSRGNEPFFILAACGIAETSRLDLAKQLTDIKDRFFPGWADGPWRDTEIKGRFLAQAHKRLKSGKPPLKPAGYRSLKTTSQVERLCDELARTFRKFRPIIYAVAVDKRSLVRHSTPMKPEGICYAFLTQRLALMVDAIYGDAEGALMVADQNHTHEKMFRSGEMLAIRTKLSSNLGKPPRFDLILDRPVWIDELLHPLDREILQLPDLVASAILELMRSDCSSSHPYHMWDDIRACFPTHWTSGLIPDGGLTIYPRPSPYPSGV